MQTSRIIFHIDMNCFFASCEIAENNGLKGKPIVIAHHDSLRKSIILSPSYEARAFGIRTTMLVRDAMKLCHHLIVVEPHMELYQQYSKKFFDYLRQITPMLEATSVDEGYLDVTEISKTVNPITLAEQIQKDLLDKYQLPCSIGIAPNKFLAKMASDMKKPLGITILRKREIDKLMWGLDISKMYGVGKKTSPKLQEVGIKTIGDLAHFQNKELLIKVLGEVGATTLFQRANGIDDSKVDPSAVDEISSISNSYTFPIDQDDILYIKNSFKLLSNTVAHRLRSKSLHAYTIGIQIKYSDFTQHSRSKGLDTAICEDGDIYEIVENLFDDFYDETQRVRLVGVFVTRLIDKKEIVKQFSIFDDLSRVDKENEIHKLLNNLKDKFGEESIKQGYYKHEKNIKTENKELK